MTVYQTGAIAGPLLAGVLIPVIGLPTLYLLDAVALLATLWATWKLPPVPPETRGERRRAGLREIGEGFRYAALHAVLLVSFLMDIVAMAFGMPRVVFPEIAHTVYDDPQGGGLALGLLFAAIPAGMVVAALFSGSLNRIRRQGVAVTISICVWGLGVALFGLAGSLWLAVIFLAVAGAGDMVSGVFRMSMLQSVATDEMRGRMQGVFSVVVVGGPRVADMWHGPAAAPGGRRGGGRGGGVPGVLALPPCARRVTTVVMNASTPGGAQPGSGALALRPTTQNMSVREPPHGRRDHQRRCSEPPRRRVRDVDPAGNRGCVRVRHREVAPVHRARHLRLRIRQHGFLCVRDHLHRR
jgi:hypothetical protein